MRVLKQQIRLAFQPRDLWIGVYWKHERDLVGTAELHIWVCLLPMLPIHYYLWYERRLRAKPVRVIDNITLHEVSQTDEGYGIGGVIEQTHELTREEQTQ